MRRMLKLAGEWGRVEKALPKVERLPGENHRDRVLSIDHETQYPDATVQIGDGFTLPTSLRLKVLGLSGGPNNPLSPTTLSY